MTERIQTEKKVHLGNGNDVKSRKRNQKEISDAVSDGCVKRYLIKKNFSI